MKIKFKKLDPGVEIAGYMHEFDAGFDLRSIEDKTLSPQERYLFKTGLALEIPKGYVGLVWDRSGLALKHGLTCLAGVVDAGYRGEIGVVLLNTSNEEFKVEKGDRIAQILFQPILQVELEEVDRLNETERGEGGFGGSGRK